MISSIIPPGCMKEKEPRVGKWGGSEPKMRELRVEKCGGFSIICKIYWIRSKKDSMKLVVEGFCFREGATASR